MIVNTIKDFMDEMERYRDIKLSESYRSIISTALEEYRNTVTQRLYSDIETNYDNEYHDIELIEIDEILQLMED